MRTQKRKTPVGAKQPSWKLGKVGGYRESWAKVADMLPTLIAARMITEHAAPVKRRSAIFAGTRLVRVTAPQVVHLAADSAVPTNGFLTHFERDAADQLAAGATLRSELNWCSIGLNFERGATSQFDGVGPAMRCVHEDPAHSALQ